MSSKNEKKKTVENYSVPHGRVGMNGLGSKGFFLNCIITGASVQRNIRCIRILKRWTWYLQKNVSNYTG